MLSGKTQYYVIIAGATTNASYHVTEIPVFVPVTINNFLSNLDVYV